MIVRRKVQPPGLPAGVVARPRLDDLFSELLEAHGTLAVFATGGSGKTVQAQMFAARYGWPLCWLTLDEADRSGSRLLFYLGEALRPLFPKSPDLVREALEAGLSLSEVAATLADSLDGRAFLMVFDDCETVAGEDEAATVLSAFLDYLPVKAQVIMLSRDELERPVARLLLEGRIGRIGDEQLALDVTEARSLLHAYGQVDRDAAEMLSETGGWVAACAFDVRLSGDSYEEAMTRYMRSEILGRLPEDEQRFLLFTSLLAMVTPRFAVGLCGPEAYGLWRRIRYRYLPATLTADRALVYHPRFRAFLRDQLVARYSAELPTLYRRHAGFLVEEGLFEDAVEIYLELGDLDEATIVAEQAMPTLVSRADWPLILRWFDQIGHERVADHPLLHAAYFRCLYGTRRIAELTDLINTTHRSGELMKIAKADPGVVTFVGLALQWHPAEALQLLQGYQVDYRAEGLRYELRVTSGRDPVAAPAETSWSDAERAVSWGLMIQGRLADLMPMLPNDQEWPPIGFYRTPHPLLGLVWQGEVGRARELLDQVPAAIRTGAHSDFWYFHEAWVAWAEDDVAGALRAARAAVTHSSHTNFGWEPFFNIIVGHFMVLDGQLDDASALLAEAQRRTAASRNRAYAEWALTFEGLACLRRDEPADALRRLRRAYRGMRRARRHLMLPFAGIYLSEAEFRMGNVAQAVEIAEETYDLTEQMGALFVLRRAVENAPDVVERLIATGDSGNRWRRLQGLRKMQPAAARPVPTAVGNSGHIVEVQTFGDSPDLIVDGTPANVRRLKTIEMAAYLALHPNGVERKRLQARLFPDADQRHGGNYYRQIVHKLRLCVGVSLERNESGLISWPEGWFVESVDQRFEQLLKEASQLTGNERLARMRAALDIPSGDYLQDSNLEWAEERRFELDLLRVEATTEAALLALQLGQMDDARELAEQAIKADPYAEPAYHTLMQVEAAVGAPGAVMAVFRRLTESLESLNLPPSSDTMQLVRRLRDDG